VFTFDNNRCSRWVIIRRQDLFGHRSGRITTHYSAAEIDNLLKATNKVCEINQEFNSSTLTLLWCVNAGLIPVGINVEQPTYASTSLH
jgi:hypothetical protein